MNNAATPPTKKQQSQPKGHWPRLQDLASRAFAFSDRFLAPLSDLGLRLVVGLVFFKSGQSKLLPDCHGLICVDPSKADLFEWEYMENWNANAPFDFPFSAATMASMTTYAELILPILLFIGLGGRIAALGLLIMALVIEFWIYPGQYYEHWYWIAILAALCVRGPGTLSVDRLLRRYLLPSPVNTDPCKTA